MNPKTQYTEGEDHFIRHNYELLNNKELAEELGRTRKSIEARLKYLNLTREVRIDVNPTKGRQKQDHKYINYSNWNTSLDTPCCALMVCTVCKDLKVITDFYVYGGKGGSKKGRKDILGIHRGHMCIHCSNKSYIEYAVETKLYYAARQRANKVGRECTIKPDDIKVPEKCPILGIPLFEGKGGGREAGWTNNNAPSLDRIDNDKGYTPDNVCVISRMANTLKGSGDIKSLLAIVAFLAEIEMGILRQDANSLSYYERGPEECIKIAERYIHYTKNANKSKEGEITESDDT